jgi:hypothetical protein
MNTNRIFDGYRIRVGYRTDINTNINIFRILNKNIICRVMLMCYAYLDQKSATEFLAV